MFRRIDQSRSIAVLFSKLLPDTEYFLTCNLAKISLMINMRYTSLTKQIFWIVTCQLLSQVASSESTDCDTIQPSTNHSDSPPHKLGPSTSLTFAIVLIAIVGLFTVFLAHGFNIIRKHVYEDKVGWGSVCIGIGIIG